MSRYDDLRSKVLDAAEEMVADVVSGAACTDPDEIRARCLKVLADIADSGIKTDLALEKAAAEQPSTADVVALVCELIKTDAEVREAVKKAMVPWMTQPK